MTSSVIRLWLSESTAGSPVRLEIQTGQSKRTFVSFNSIPYFQQLCCSHLPFGCRKPWPKTEWSSPIIFHRDCCSDWSPCLPSPSLLSWSILLPKILHGWPGLAVSLVLASPMLSATMQRCVHMEIFSPRPCPVPKCVLSATMLTRLQIPRLYHLWGRSSSLPILQKEQQHQQGVWNSTLVMIIFRYSLNSILGPLNRRWYSTELKGTRNLGSFLCCRNCKWCLVSCLDSKAAPPSFS